MCIMVKYNLVGLILYENMMFHRRIHTIQYTIRSECHSEPYGIIVYYRTLRLGADPAIQEQDDKKNGGYVFRNRSYFVFLSVFEIL